MKITKRQLQRIIKEEKQKLNEGSIDDAAKEMAKLIDQIGSLPFARAALDALGDEATEKGWSIVNWVKRNYRLRENLVNEGGSSSDIRSTILTALDPRRSRYDGGGPMSGIDLIDYVMDNIPGHVYHQRVYDIMDEMLEDGELRFNVEEDEWSLA